MAGEDGEAMAAMMGKLVGPIDRLTDAAIEAGDEFKLTDRELMMALALALGAFLAAEDEGGARDTAILALSAVLHPAARAFAEQARAEGLLPPLADGDAR